MSHHYFGGDYLFLVSGLERKQLVILGGYLADHPSTSYSNSLYTLLFLFLSLFSMPSHNKNMIIKYTET